MNSLTPLLSPFVSHTLAAAALPASQGFRARTNCHGVPQSDVNPVLSVLSSLLRGSTPKGRAGLSAQMEAPPPTPPPTALSGR